MKASGSPEIIDFRRLLSDFKFIKQSDRNLFSQRRNFAQHFFVFEVSSTDQPLIFQKAFVSVIKIIISFFKRRLIQPVVNLLKQGMTPKKLSATIALGTVVGILPAFGFTTFVGTALAARFRLNIAATVLISYLVQPLQLLLIIPFIKLGILLMGLEEFTFSFAEMQALFKADWLHALNLLWKANLAGVVAWAIVSVPAVYLLYYLFLPLLKVVMPASPMELSPVTLAAEAEVAESPILE